MKLKELPLSWWRARRLAAVKVHDLERKNQPLLPVIVSLTSIPSRLDVIHLTIRSLLLQSQRPEKIVLWLNEQLREQIPDSLSQLRNSIFEIRFSDLDCSHRKLIHSLEAFPEKIIVTCDDDEMYGRTWLESLYKDHLCYPESIIAHECRVIDFIAPGQPAAYHQWQVELRRNYSAPWLMPIGYGGVLYPPGCLHPDVLNRELFLHLAPRADDLWFKAMSYRVGTSVRSSSSAAEKSVPIIASQKESLKKTNVRQDGNYKQWLALCNYYGF